MSVLALPFILKSYVGFFENIQRISNIDARLEAYYRLDAELEVDFVEILDFCIHYGWKFPENQQVELSEQLKIISNNRRAIAEKIKRKIRLM